MSVEAKLVAEPVEKPKVPHGLVRGLDHNAKTWSVRVTCPLCSMGWADVVVVEKAHNLDANVKEPRRCNWPACKRLFRLKWLYQLTAEPVEGEPGLRVVPG